MPSDNSGCLTAILQTLGLKPYTRKDWTITRMEEDAEELPYRVKDNFLTPAELSFYHVLNSIVGSHLTVLSKVRLIDLFYVARPNENYSYRGKIAQKHVDFVLCQPKTMTPIAGIELDDSSHQREDRQERDEFVNKVFEAAELPLVRISAQRTYNTHEISALLKSALSKRGEGTVQQSNEQNYSKGNPPLCPKCGVPMVLRTVKKGQHKGKQFFGCPNFPNCRSMKKLHV